MLVPLFLFLLACTTRVLEMQTSITITIVITSLCRLFGTYRILKWPFYAFLFVLLVVDLCLYVGVRVMIHVLTKRSERSFEAARSYEEWLQLAKRADEREGRDIWRREPANADFDWRHVKATTERLRAARESGDAAALRSLLQMCLKHSPYGELHEGLYVQARAGGKLLLEEYRDEVCCSLRALASERLGGGSAAASARDEFFLAARTSLGGCALVLSGGAMFGVFHFGVVKALLELNALPRIICGASAGAVVAAVTCTRRDEELAEVLSDQSDLYREMGPQGPFQ